MLLRKTSNQRTANEYSGMIPMNVLDNQSPVSIHKENTQAIAKENNSNMNMNANPAPSGLNQTLINQLQQQQLQSQYDDLLNTQISLEWINKPWVQRIVRFCALASFISICANTPKTLANYFFLKYVIFTVDLISTLVFTIEMIAKIKIKGLFKGDTAYIFDRWCQFDGIMVIFHIVSVVLQVRFALGWLESTSVRI